MNGAEFVAAARDRLDEAGYRVVTIEAGDDSVVAQRSDRRASFLWTSWMKPRFRSHA